METRYFDLAVLDIMGVDGYELLKIAVRKNIIAVMLTAGALSPEDTVKSFKSGAVYFVPKDEMVNMESFLNDVLEAKEKREIHGFAGLNCLGLSIINASVLIGKIVTGNSGISF